MDLHVKFDGHEIIVTRPGTDMMTAYRKAPDRPQRIRPSPHPRSNEFHAHAFQAAIKKARELGWIV